MHIVTIQELTCTLTCLRYSKHSCLAESSKPTWPLITLIFQEKFSKALSETEEMLEIFGREAFKTFLGMDNYIASKF